MKVFFSTTKANKISKLIRFFTEKNAKVLPSISHCGPVLGELESMQLGLSADEILVCMVDLNRYRTPDCVFRVYELPEIITPSNWVPVIVKQTNEQIYPHLELLWFVWRWAMRNIIPWWTGKNWFQYGTTCSELLVKTLRLSGYGQYFKDIDENSIDPIEVENILINIPGVVLTEKRD